MIYKEYILLNIIRMKKIRFFLLLLFGISWFWVSFANPIVITDSYISNDCYKFKNVEIDNYNVVIGTNGFERWKKWEGYIPKTNEYIKETSKIIAVLLIDKSIDVDNMKWDIIDNSIFLGNIYPDSNIQSKCDVINLWEIVKRWSDYKLVFSKTKWIKQRAHEIKNIISIFPFFWLLAIVIETLGLFIIAKLFRRKNQISNWKLIIFWIIPTTITLPLLWFVLPLLLWKWLLYVIIWEILVTVIETVIIKYWLKISWIKAIIASVICNILSFIAWSFFLYVLDGINLIIVHDLEEIVNDLFNW